MLHLAALSLLLTAGAPVAPSGDLVVWLSRSAHATQGLGMEAVLAQTLRDHSVLVVSAQDLASLDSDSLARLRACQTDDCVLEIAGAFGLERAYIGRVDAGARPGVSVTRVQRAGGAPASGKAAWDGSTATFRASLESCLGPIVAGPARAAAPAPRAPAAGRAEAEHLDPAARDLKSRVRILADRLHAGFVERAPDAALLRVAVLDFDNLGADAQSQQIGAVVSEVLLSELAQKPRVLVVERKRLKSLVGELKLQSTADIDPRTATEIGKFLGAASMIVGSVTEAGSQFVLSARQVSVENAAVIQAESVSVDRAELVALSRDLVEVKSRSGAALRSAVLPGWGEIYNGDVGVGMVFLGAGLAAAGAAGTFGVLSKNASDAYHRNTPDSVGQRDAANRYGMLTNGMIGAYALVWAANIAYAYFTGRDVADVRSLGGGGSFAATF